MIHFIFGANFQVICSVGECSLKLRWNAKEARPDTSLPLVQHSFVNFEWTDAKGWEVGSRKVSVEMTLSGDEIDI